MVGLHFEWHLPAWEVLDGDDEVVATGEWRPSTLEDYWGVVHGDETVKVYATRTDPGVVIMTSWCTPEGVPLVAAVDLWNGGEKAASEFFRFYAA